MKLEHKMQPKWQRR